MYIKNEILVERHPTKYFIKKNPSNRQVNMFFINSGALRSNQGGHPYWSMDLALHQNQTEVGTLTGQWT
jgi:hypothetical protein